MTEGESNSFRLGRAYPPPSEMEAFLDYNDTPVSIHENLFSIHVHRTIHATCCNSFEKQRKMVAVFHLPLEKHSFLRFFEDFVEKGHFSIYPLKKWVFRGFFDFLQVFSL